jgi:methyl-accepting chemotaxis protein
MFENMSLKSKFISLEVVSFVMFLAMSIFAVMMLKGAVADQKVSIDRRKRDIVVMESVSTMDIATLKEAKIAKDVWLRGGNPDKLKKYRDDFLVERGRFEHSLDEAKKSLQQLALGHEQEFADFLSRMDNVKQLHDVMSEKYLAQIDAHRGDAVDSDNKVAGIDREVIAAVKGLRDDFVVFTDQKAAEKLQMAEEDYAQRRTIVTIWVLVSLSLSFALASLIIRQIMRQLGGDPREVANVVNWRLFAHAQAPAAGRQPAGQRLSHAIQVA